jgi:probable HAF family extracellular repeat protein
LRTGRLRAKLWLLGVSHRVPTPSHPNMSHVGPSRRAAPHARGSLLSSPAPARAVPALLLALLAACGVEMPTHPTGRPPAPTEALHALTGASSTQIFPTVPPGEIQPVGVAVGLNDAGQVTGSAYSLVLSDDDFVAFRWSSGSGAVALVGCCDTKWGNDINDAGTVVGVAQTSALLGNHAWVATSTSMTTLPALAGSNPELSSGAVAVNNPGQVVGVSPSGMFAYHAVLWSAAGAIQDLGTLGGTNSAAIDINDAGQVIGWSQIAGDAATHFFLWTVGTGLQDLNTVIHPDVTSVVEINAAGQISGTYLTTNGESHAFLYTPGSGLRDLGTLGGSTSAPTGLNDRGDVVGSSTLADGSTHAFLWTASNGMEDVTEITGIAEVHRLNDELQTLTGALAPSPNPVTGHLSPRLVQLNVTPTVADAPPVAAFTWSCARKQCVFDASTSSDDDRIVAYAWDFDKDKGGGRTKGAIVKTTYPKGGTHDVVLTVTDTKGQTNSVTHTVTLP